MDEFEYKGFKYRIVSVVDATVELISAGKLTGKIVVPEEVEYQNQKCKVVAIRGERKTEYYDYQPDDKRRKVERRSREVTCPVFVGRLLQSFQDKLEVVLPKSLKKIGDYAFYKCYNLVSVNIPVGVTSIGENAFYDCRFLTSITTIPNSVTSIGHSAFKSCHKLTSITISNSVTSIGQSAFEFCFGLTSVTISNSVTSIGDNAFCNCSALTSVTIENEEGKVAIGKHAFLFTAAKITYVGKPKDGVEKIVRIMVEVPTLLALLDGKATEKEVQAICQQVKTLGEDAENLEKRLKKCVK